MGWKGALVSHSHRLMVGAASEIMPNSRGKHQAGGLLGRLQGGWTNDGYFRVFAYNLVP